MADAENASLACLLHWVRERESVRIRKDGGAPFPWTADPIISAYRFCNVRREDDRVTVWIREEIRERFAGHPMLWFMLCTARQINWPETLDELMHHPSGWPSKDAFSPERMGRALEERAKRGAKVFTGAYIITAPAAKGAKKTTHVAMTTLGALWRDRSRLAELFGRPQISMRATHRELMAYDGWGQFLAYQTIVDMRFTPLLAGAADIATWAAAGPGTIRGLNRIHNRRLDFPLPQDRALSEMRTLYPIIKTETGIELDFSDVPNVLCETDKYLRVKRGEGKPRASYVPGRGA